MKIADMIYVLDLQNKNKHINQILAKYGLDSSSLKTLREALEKGSWSVV